MKNGAGMRSSPTEMARDAVEVDDYDEAIRFASLAQSIGRSVPDRFFRKHLLDVRLEIDAIQNAFQALPPNSAADGATRPPQQSAARFRVLSKGDFEHGLNDLQNVDDVEPAHVGATGTRADPPRPNSQLALARGWFQLAGQAFERRKGQRDASRSNTGIEACQADLSRAQRVEVQQDLDAITAVLGRESEQMDLTELPPVDVSVGYGTFGINKNIDAASNPQSRSRCPKWTTTRCLVSSGPVPPHASSTWCRKGPSSFRPWALVNAATSDGVRFVVKANGSKCLRQPAGQGDGRTRADPGRAAGGDAELGIDRRSDSRITSSIIRIGSIRGSPSNGSRLPCTRSIDWLGRCLPVGAIVGSVVRNRHSNAAAFPGRVHADMPVA